MISVRDDPVRELISVRDDPVRESTDEFRIHYMPASWTRQLIVVLLWWVVRAVA